MIAVSCVVVLAGALGGCVVGPDYGTPKASFQTMVAAANAGDKDAMLACFDTKTKGYIQELETLAGESRNTKRDAPSKRLNAQFKNAKVGYGKEEIRGDAATLVVTKDGKTDTVKFRKEDGDWKISIPEMKMAVEIMRTTPGLMTGTGKKAGKGTEKPTREQRKRGIPYVGY
jgi:hypothetical protein